MASLNRSLRPRKNNKNVKRRHPSVLPHMVEYIRDSLDVESQTVLATHNNYVIKKCDLDTLETDKWVCDDIINVYLTLIKERNDTNRKYPKIYVFSSFFYYSLDNRGYEHVKRWIKKANIFENEILLLPIHLPSHWVLMLVDFRTKEIVYYDSLGGVNWPAIELTENFLQQEFHAKYNSQIDMTFWKRLHREDIVLQENCSDCGVFVCAFAETLSRRGDIDFGQEDMAYFRQRIQYEILVGKLL